MLIPGGRARLDRHMYTLRPDRDFSGLTAHVDVFQKAYVTTTTPDVQQSCNRRLACCNCSTVQGEALFLALDTVNNSLSLMHCSSIAISDSGNVYVNDRTVAFLKGVTSEAEDGTVPKSEHSGGITKQCMACAVTTFHCNV